MFIAVWEKMRRVTAANGDKEPNETHKVDRDNIIRYDL